MLLLPESWKAGLQLLQPLVNNQILLFCFPLCPIKVKAEKTPLKWITLTFHYAFLHPAADGAPITSVPQELQAFRTF